MQAFQNIKKVSTVLLDNPVYNILIYNNLLTLTETEQRKPFQQNIFQKAATQRCFATLLKSHFGMGVLL